MMDNYDRTMELVNVAYDSNGKAAEQFGKYSDTLEYKLNKLTNTWEQMRLKFLKSEFLKGAVDSLTDLLKKVQDFSGTDLLKLGITWITFGKYAITNFIKGLQQSMGSLQTAVNKIVSKVSSWISSKTNNINIGLNTDSAEAELAQITAELNTLKSKIIEIDGESITIGARLEGISASQMKNLVAQYENEFKRVQQNAANLGYNSIQSNQYASNAANYATGLTKDEYQAAKKMVDANNIQQDINKRKQAVAAAGTAIGQSFAVAFTSAVTAVTTQDSPGKVIGTVLISGITAMLPAVASAGSAMAAAATAGISLAITAVVAGIAGIWKAIENNKAKNLEMQINSDPLLKAKKNVEELTEAHGELTEAVSEAQSKLSEEKTEYESLIAGKEALEEYQNKLYLTTEEEENFINTSNELAEQFPELIDYYDDQKNAIMKMGEAWEIAADNQRKYYAEAAAEEAAAEFELKLNEYDTLVNQQQVADETVEAVEQYAQELYSASSLETDNLGQSSAWVWNDGNWYREISVENWLKSFNPGNAIADLQGPDLLGYFKGIIDNYDEDAEAHKKGIALLEILKQAGVQIDENSTDLENIEAIYDKLDDDIGYADSIKNSMQQGLEIVMQKGKASNELSGEIEKANEAVSESIKNMASAQLTSEEEYIDSSENVQRIYTQMADNILDLDYEKLKQDFYNASEAAKTYFDEYGNLLPNADPTVAHEALKNWMVNNSEYTEQIKSVLDKLSEDEREIIDNYYKQRANTAPNLTTRLSIIQELSIDDDAKQAMIDLEQDNIEAYNRIIEDFTNWTNTSFVRDPTTGLNINKKLQWFEGLNEAAQQSLHNAIQNLPEEFREEYTQEISQMSQNVDPEILNQLFTIDLSNVDLTNIDSLKEQFIDSIQNMPEYMDMTTEELESIWDEYRQYCEDYGAIDLSVNITGVESMTDSIEEQLTNIVDSYNDAAKYIETSISNNGLNYSEYQKLSDILDEVNLKIEDYTTLQENGKYALDRDAMSEAYQSLANDTDTIIENIKASIQARINDLEAILAEKEQQEGVNNQYQSLLENQDLYNKAIYEGAVMWGLMNETPVSAPATFASAWKQTSDKSIQETKDLIDEYKALLEDDSYLQGAADAVVAARTEMLNRENEAVTNGTKALRNNSSASSDAADAAEKLAEAQEKLNEALYGTENYKNAADHLANYTERLEELVEKADKAKESLENLGKEDSASELIATYAENVKLENVTRTAENQVLQQSMNDLLNILNENYSAFFQKVGDTWMWNASVVDAQMNDNIKDFIIESIENLNEYQSQIDENLDAIEEREKEFSEMRKTALDSRITLEEEVMDILKENYQKEIDAAQEKYDALKEADDNYLDALEEAINKQRELRDRANQYEDLAQKERKLALKQRDTSGTNRKDTLQLQQEVEKSRQEMLDNEVDRLLDSMREMYELQQESRDAEIEYMNAMIENSQLLQEANEIIASFSTREDMLAWFFENNKELADMSVAATEKYKMELEEMYDAAELYYAMSETNLEELTSFTEEEVSNTVATIGETLTLEAERSYNEMKETVDKEVEDAKQAVIDAQKAVEDAASSASSAVSGAAGAIGSSADYIKNKFDEIMSSANNKSTNLFDIATPTATGREEEQKGKENAKNASNTKSDNDSNKIKTSPLQNNVIAIKKKLYSMNDKDFKNYLIDTYGYDNLNSDAATKDVAEWTKNHYITIKNTEATNGSSGQYHEVTKKVSYYDLLNRYGNLKSFMPGVDSINSYADSYLKDTYKKWGNPNAKITQYATGGLVNYTGPAWVDGTPSKPEAFLNSEDTKRIGEAAKLLSNLPILNSTSNASTQLSTNVGDTSIEIHINVESISSDYDVDRLAERIKSDIVDASKPVGTPVILKR